MFLLALEIPLKYPKGHILSGFFYYFNFLFLFIAGCAIEC